MLLGLDSIEKYENTESYIIKGLQIFENDKIMTINHR